MARKYFTLNICSLEALTIGLLMTFSVNQQPASKQLSPGQDRHIYIMAWKDTNYSRP